MHFGKFRDYSVKIGNYKKSFECLPVNVGCISLAVVIMTTANEIHLTFSGRQYTAFVLFPIFTDLYRRLTETAEVHYTPVTLTTCLLAANFEDHWWPFANSLDQDETQTTWPSDYLYLQDWNFQRKIWNVCISFTKTVKSEIWRIIPCQLYASIVRYTCRDWVRKCILNGICDNNVVVSPWKPMVWSVIRFVSSSQYEWIITPYDSVKY